MITKFQAGAIIGFTLATLWGSQMIGDLLGSAVAQSFTDNVRELGSRQTATSDRSGDHLNSDGTMFGVTLRRTRVYDAQGLQEPKSVLWKTPKLFAINPVETFSMFGPGIRQDTIYHGALSIIVANKEAYFTERMDDGHIMFVIDLRTTR